MRAQRRFSEVPELGFLEFALVRRQCAALKTIILLRQIHRDYRLIVWFANTRATPSAILLRGFAARTPQLRHLLAPLTPKTSDASFCSVHHKRTQKLARDRRRTAVSSTLRGASALSSGTKAELGFRDCMNEKLEQVLKKATTTCSNSFILSDSVSIK